MSLVLTDTSNCSKRTFTAFRYASASVFLRYQSSGSAFGIRRDSEGCSKTFSKVTSESKALAMATTWDSTHSANAEPSNGTSTLFNMMFSYETHGLVESNNMPQGVKRQSTPDKTIS